MTPAPNPLQQAMQLHQAGRLAEAEAVYARLLAQMPASYPLLHLFGLLRLQQGRVTEALALMEAALQAQPGAPETLTNYAIALDAAGRTAEALTVLDQVVAARPGDAKALNNRGALYSKLGDHAAALADFDRALARDPRHGEAHNHRGLALAALGDPQAALESHDRAVALVPGHPEYRNNRGLALRALNRQSEALAEFDRVIAQSPHHPGAGINRAASLWALGRIDEALAAYDRVLEMDPRQPLALQSRGELRWARKKELAPAIADLEQALRLAPDLAYAPGNLLQMKMHAADWRDFADARTRLDEGVRTGAPVAEPFVYQGLSASPADLLACARSYARRRFPARPPLHSGTARQDGKIRIGYVSGEFRGQATAYLTAGLYEAHDRARFEIIGFDNGHDDGSAMRARLERGLDRIVDISALSDADAAARVMAEKTDILVNLNGYFGALRMGVFAHRPAPVQVNYLGFPGSLGAPYMDYILADRTVIPPDAHGFYDERVVTLPHSYQINDDRRAIAGTRPDRGALGLPANGFVFCHFNYGYKLTPDIFALWMRLLRQVEGSVLWLLQSHSLFAANLRQHAVAAGVDAARLVFAPQLPVEDHLARLAAGDLFLDSQPSGAHTTASDALWAGLPLLTCRGTAFSGRVATSLLTAAGLPELVAENLLDYETLALALARDPARLAGLRARLAQNRRTAPLFDTARTTRAIEAAYQGMFDRWQRGEAPEGFAVTE